MPTADLNNLKTKSEPTYHAQNISAEQISAYNPDYEEQFDHSNQEFTQLWPQNPNWGTHKQENIRKLPLKRGKNPLDRYGNPTKCAICHSINHGAQNCSDRESQNTYVVNEVVLHQSDYDNPNERKHLTSETWSSALLDCGASKTVCGKEWLTQYINNLSDTDQSSIWRI